MQSIDYLGEALTNGKNDTWDECAQWCAATFRCSHWNFKANHYKADCYLINACGNNFTTHSGGNTGRNTLISGNRACGCIGAADSKACMEGNMLKGSIGN